MEADYGGGQVQVQLMTKQPQYAVPETPYSIETNVSIDELNTLVNTILQENNEHNNVNFDFLVFGEYLRTRLGDHLKEKAVSFEDVIQIEYVERYPAPEPKDCLLHDDWVSAVKTCGNWILTGCYDNTLNLWTTKGNHVLTIPGHSSPIKAVAWISCGKTDATFISCSQDQTAMLWEWNVEQNSVDCVYVCKGHERGVESVDVSPDKSRFATGSWDTMLKIWSADIDDKDDKTLKKARPESGKSRTPSVTLQGHRECISSVQWMDQATILTGSWDHTLKIWDLNLEGMKSEITGDKSFFDASFSKLNGLVITASADKNLRLYDPRSNQGAIIKNTYFGHNLWIQSVVWSSDEEYLFLSGSYDSRVKLWDYRSPNAPLYDLCGHEDKVLDVDWSNSKYLVSGGSDNTVRIFRSKKAMEKTINE